MRVLVAGFKCWYATYATAMWPRLSQANSGAGNASRKIRTNAKALCAVFIVFSRHEDVPCGLRGGRRQDIAIRPLVRQAVSHNGAKNPRGSMRTTKVMQQRQALSGHASRPPP